MSPVLIFLINEKQQHEIKLKAFAKNKSAPGAIQHSDLLLLAVYSAEYI